MFEGEHFTVPTPTTSSPSPTRKGHPPIWVACGNPGTFTQAGEMGIGAIAFNFEPVYTLKGRIDAYKEGIANCTEPHRPVQERQRDDHQRGHLPERPEARPGRSPCASAAATCTRWSASTTTPSPSQTTSPTWPETIPAVADEDMLDRLIEGGWLLCGEPDEVAEQLSRYQEVGCDQLVFGLPSDSVEHDEVLEMLEVFGTKVIPQFDKDPVHSTTRYRATAEPKYPDVQLPGAGHRRGGAADQRPDPAGRHPHTSSYRSPAARPGRRLGTAARRRPVRPRARPRAGRRWWSAWR